MATRKKKLTMGEMIDELDKLRDQKRTLQKQVDDIEERFNALQGELMAAMDEQHTTKGAGSRAAVSISESVVANIVDWDALCAYVKKKNYFHLLQHRVSDPAARELFEKEGKVPGLEPFTKRRLTLNKL